MAQTSKPLTKRQFKVTLSVLGGVLALVLLAGSALAFWGSNFATTQVQDQLEQQKITFPEKGSPALDPEKYPGLQQYAGEAVDTGPKAKAYAEEYILVHMNDSSDGKTYAEVSSEARENPNDAELQALRESLFKGNMLRTSLLTAYSFSVMGMIAAYAAAALLVAGALVALLSLMCLARSRKV